MTSLHDSESDLIRRKEPLFPWFLLATVLPILAMPFTNLDGNIAERVCLPLVSLNLVWMSLRIMPGKFLAVKLLGGHYPYRLLGQVAAVLLWMPYLLGEHVGQMLKIGIVGTISMFFVLTAVRILQLLARLQGICAESLCLGAAGYIHLGLCAGLIATLLELAFPQSFALGTMLPGSELVERLTYFSFITLGGVGYGDVLPKSPAAEFFSVFLSISGTLYITFMIGLLLSRFLADIK